MNTQVLLPGPGYMSSPHAGSKEYLLPPFRDQGKHPPSIRGPGNNPTSNLGSTNAPDSMQGPGNILCTLCVSLEMSHTPPGFREYTPFHTHSRKFPLFHKRVQGIPQHCNEDPGITAPSFQDPLNTYFHPGATRYPLPPSLEIPSCT